MTLRIAILTTDTPHHRYFLRRMQGELPSGSRIVLNLFEEKPYPWRRNARRHLRETFPDLWRGLALNPYWQPAWFGARQAAFEERHFFPDGDRSLPDAFPTHRVRSVNDADAIDLLRTARPDIALVYGTGVIRARMFGLPPLGTVNAHGGLLPGYRGLDTNLWAIHEGRPEDMAVTLHFMDDDIDTGAVILQEHLQPVPGLCLTSLRYHTTLVCCRLFADLIRRADRGPLAARAQEVGRSRYFGPMPALLKLGADRRLRAYAAGAAHSAEAVQ